MEKFFAVVVNRFAKVLGALVKGVGYIFHFIFPNKRFTIPTHSRAKFKGRETKIPKIIWQTNFTNKVTLPLYVNYLFNRLLSLDWDYRYVSTEEREEYLKQNLSKRQFDAFIKLTDGAAQADFWRLFVLDKEGGIYLDIDGHLVWPASWIVDSHDEVFIKSKKAYVNNYFIASSKNNKILQNTLEVIVDNIETRNFTAVFNLTGPKVLNNVIEKYNYYSVLYRYIAIQGSFTNEYFQYVDKKNGKWTHLKKDDLLRDS